MSTVILALGGVAFCWLFGRAIWLAGYERGVTDAFERISAEPDFSMVSAHVAEQIKAAQEGRQ